jgi:hypothetical protein
MGCSQPLPFAQTRWRPVEHSPEDSGQSGILRFNLLPPRSFPKGGYGNLVYTSFLKVLSEQFVGAAMRKHFVLLRNPHAYAWRPEVLLAE